MRKIAILGCENSHADFFIKLIKEKEEFSDVEVFGVYSDERETAEKLKEKFGVAVMENYSDAVDKVDGILITARHGDNHFKYAAPYVESKIPMFIDKPITVSEKDVKEFFALLKSNDVRVSGGSSLKHDEYVLKLKNDRLNNVGGKTLGGFVRAPYSKENDYGGFYFYAQHLVEMVCEIFGRFPKSVIATQSDITVNVIFRYDDFDCAGLFCDKKYSYFASRMSEKKSDAYAISDTADWFYKEFKEYYNLLCGGQQEMTYEELAAPVFIMNAIERSLNSNREEQVKYE